MFAKVVCGNALNIPLPDESVQCVVTSPPYWGLRDYGVAGQLGLEPTPDEYVDNMVEVFREVWRVLRPDGTLWLNMGDSYAGSWGAMSCPGDSSAGRRFGGRDNGGNVSRPVNSRTSGVLKPKDMVGIPWRVAFALQADGWWLRSDIIWHKPNPMPESVTDRPTSAHEHLFLLAKSERYYYDHEAIKEPGTLSSQKRIDQATFYQQQGGDKDYRKTGNGNRSARKAVENLAHRYRADKQRGHSRRHAGFNARWGSMSKEEQCNVMRNKRDVWKIATRPFAGAHFATFPPALVEPCVLGGTSTKGQCTRCGIPWRRITEKGDFVPMRRVPGDDKTLQAQRLVSGASGPSATSAMVRGGVNQKVTVDWVPGCECNTDDPVPQLVLDPFAGTGTVGQVAIKHGRSFVGVELSMDYISLAKKRLQCLPVVMF